MKKNFKEIIEKEFQNETTKSPEIKEIINEILEALTQGKIRVAEKNKSGWHTHEWIKKAILLYFRDQPVRQITNGEFTFIDKVPVRKWDGSEGVRVVPQATARYGAFIAPGCILMPSYINIGAYVDSGTLVDTWATVGSCAQVGKNVHLSGGVGIGGVLEPIQSLPVIIGDHVFIGSRSVIVEGVVIDDEAVIGANVTLTSSTKIIDVTQPSSKIYKGYIPPRSVVISGSYLKEYPAGKFLVPCALIIGKRKESTDHKTTLNDALRSFFKENE